MGTRPVEKKTLDGISCEVHTGHLTALSTSWIGQPILKRGTLAFPFYDVDLSIENMSEEI